MGYLAAEAALDETMLRMKALERSENTISTK
jgi:hypothetical protein